MEIQKINGRIDEIHSELSSLYMGKFNDRIEKLEKELANLFCSRRGKVSKNINGVLIYYCSMCGEKEVDIDFDICEECVKNN